MRRLGTVLQVVVITAGAVFSFKAATKLQEGKIEKAAIEFRQLTAESKDALMARMWQYRLALEGLRGLLNVVEVVQRKDIENYVQSLDLNTALPGLSGLGYIVEVKSDNAAGFTNAQRTDGAPRFTIHPDTGEETRFVIKFIEPRAGNEELLGLDITFEFGRRAAAIELRDTGAARLTPRILLVQEKSRQPGFLLLLPDYRLDFPLTTVAARRAAFRGWVYAPFVGARTLKDLLLSQGVQYDLRVYDGTETAPETLIYSTAGIDQVARAARFAETTQIELLGRTWTLSWASTPTFEGESSGTVYWVALSLGLSMTALLAYLFWFQALRQRTVEQLVNQRTRELEAQILENKSVMENPVLGIIVAGPHGRILHCNTIAAVVLGLGEADGASSYLFDAEPQFAGLAHRERRRIERRGKSGSIAVSVKKSEWKTPEGEDRATYFVRDITDEEQTTVRYLAAERRLELALRASEIGVFEVDSSTGKSVVSDTWKRGMEVPESQESFDAQAYFEAHVDADDLKILRANDLACISGKKDRSLTDFRVHLPSGTKWMRSEAVVGQLDESGRALTLLGTQVDISERKRIEQMKSDFVATVSHELRTPLTSVKGAVTLLQHALGSDLPPSAQRLLTIALSNVDRLADLVNDILNLEKAQSGRMRIEISAVAPDEILAKAGDQMQLLADASGIRLRCESLRDPPEILVDPRRLLQVLANFISNACKFAPMGSEIVLGGSPEGDRFRLWVRDSGPGVPRSFLPKMFLPFSQADSSDTREKGGTGLGLSISREIVERLHGSIGYRRTGSGETEFYVDLPVSEASSPIFTTMAASR